MACVSLNVIDYCLLSVWAVYNLHWQPQFQFILSQHANNAVSIWVSNNSSTRLHVWARTLWVLSNVFLVTYVPLLTPKYTCVLPKPIDILSKWCGHLQLFLPVLLATDADHGFLSHFKLDLYQYRVVDMSVIVINYCLLPVWALSALATSISIMQKSTTWRCSGFQTNSSTCLCMLFIRALWVYQPMKIQMTL